MRPGIRFETWVAITAVIVAVVTIYYSNRNSRRQILITKLEELYQLIGELSQYYGKFMELWFKVEEQRSSEYKELQTLSQYYIIRDQKISEIERSKIRMHLSRIHVLAMCYTKNSLRKKTLEYEDLMYCFYDFISNCGSTHQELKWKEGFPDYENFYIIIQDLKQRIITKI